MKTKHTHILPALAALLLLGQYAQADDGTWTQITGGDADGNWTNAETGNWSGGVVADGGAFTAFFDSLDITSNSTVSLGEPRTIGTLIFGDTDPSSGARWTLDNGGSSANILTLGGAATITVDTMSSVNNSGSNVTISAIIDGVDGLTKNGTGSNSTGTNNTAGTGTLTLSGANTYTGATQINSGTIRAANASAFGGVAGGKLLTNVVNIADGGRLNLGGVSIANTVNINGNALSVSGNSTLSGLVNLQSDSSVYVGNGGNWNLTFSGSLDLADYVLTAAVNYGNYGPRITGTLTGGATSGIVKGGSGWMTMSADGSGYSGTTRHSLGTIAVGSDTAMGTGTIAFDPNNDQTVTFRSTDATDRIIATDVIVNAATVTTGNGNSSITLGSGTTGNLLFTGDVSLDAFRQFRIANAVTEFSGEVTGVGGFNKTTNSGTLILSGTNSYAGATSTSAGAILQNGTHTGGGNYNVSGTGTLGGTGSTTSDVFVTAGGTLSPGASIESLGVGGVSITDSTYLYEINSSLGTADLTFASDAGMAIDLSNATLTLADLGAGTLADGTKFTLFSYNDGLTGTFNGIADLSTFSAVGHEWTINYADSSAGSNFTSEATSFGTSFVTITTIPEPSTLFLMGLSLLAVCCKNFKLRLKS